MKMMIKPPNYGILCELLIETHDYYQARGESLPPAVAELIPECDDALYAHNDQAIKRAYDKLDEALKVQASI